MDCWIMEDWQNPIRQKSCVWQPIHLFIRPTIQSISARMNPRNLYPSANPSIQQPTTPRRNLNRGYMKLEVWQRGIDLFEMAFRLAEPISDFKWKSQFADAAQSVSANIAEGYARKSPRDRIRYYEYALGSVEESRAWFHVARRAIPPQTLGSRVDQLTSIRRLLLTMIANERRSHNWNSPRRA